MNNDEFEKHLQKVKNSLSKYSKKEYKYHIKSIEKEINQLRYDLNGIVEIIGCIADGYTELYKLLVSLIKVMNDK